MRAKAKWIMGIVAVLFVGWMIYGYGMDIAGRGASASNVVGRVNGRPIDATSFYTAVRNEQERRRQQELPPPVTLEDQRQLEDQVFEDMVQSLVLRDELNRRGIEVTDEEIIDAARNSPPPEVMQAPQFQTDGQFDLQKYQRFIAASADPTFLLALEARYRDELPRLKLYEQLTAGVMLSDAALWREFRDRNDTAAAAVLQLTARALIPDSLVAVSDAQLEAYYREHQSDFERPATAVLSYLALSRVPNAADSAAALARAQAARAEIAGGVAFADVAGRESADSSSRANGGDLGESRKGSFVKEFEDAALALRPGQLSEPVKSPFGYHIIRLEAKTDSTLHARHVLIPIELSGAHLEAVEAKADTLDLFAAEQDRPEALDEVAERLDLTVEHAPHLLEGNRLPLHGTVVGDVGIWAFTGVPMGETSPVMETPTAYFVFRLDSLIAAGVPPLAQIREQVRAAAVAERPAAALRTIAQEIETEVRGGTSLETIAQRRGLTVRTVGPLTRYLPTPVLQGAPAVVGAIFGLSVGETGGPIDTPQGTYFVRTLRKVLADSSAFVAQLDGLRASAVRRARQEQVQLVLASLRKQATVRDLRREVEAAQRKAAANAPTSPSGRS